VDLGVNAGQELDDELPNSQREFTDHKNNQFTCPICLFVMTDAQVIPCGHEFCKKCLTDLTVYPQSPPQFACPLCRKMTEIGTTQHAYGSQCKIDLLHIICRNAGCTQKGPRSTIIKHEMLCAFLPFHCSYCSSLSTVGDLHDHYATCSEFPRLCF